MNQLCKFVCTLCHVPAPPTQSCMNVLPTKPISQRSMSTFISNESFVQVCLHPMPRACSTNTKLHRCMLPTKPISQRSMLVTFIQLPRACSTNTMQRPCAQVHQHNALELLMQRPCAQIHQHNALELLTHDHIGSIPVCPQQLNRSKAHAGTSLRLAAPPVSISMSLPVTFSQA